MCRIIEEIARQIQTGRRIIHVDVDTDAVRDADREIAKYDACQLVAADRNGLLCCTAGEHVLRFLPPLNVKDSNIEEALEMIGDALEELYTPDAK